MSQWIRSALVQIMACRLYSTKPLSEPTLEYCQSDPEEQTPVKFFVKIQTFSFTKIIHLKMSAKWQSFCPKGDELTQIPATHFSIEEIPDAVVSDLYNLSYTVWLYIGSHFLYICMDYPTFGFPHIFTETFQLWKPSDTKWHFTQFNAPHFNSLRPSDAYMRQ